MRLPRVWPRVLQSVLFGVSPFDPIAYFRRTGGDDSGRRARNAADPSSVEGRSGHDAAIRIAAYWRSFFSYGAPVPDEPTNSFVPSGKVMSRPFARGEPSFAWKPSTVISMPGGSEFLFQPRRSSAFGAPPSTAQRSTFPSGPFTSMWIQECGLLHSILTTVPFILTGLFASNSAANEWCAVTGAAAATSSAAPAITRNSFLRIWRYLRDSIA